MPSFEPGRRRCSPRLDPIAVGTAAATAYRRVVEQARQPGFFTDCGVPDTVDGRFELICLHAFLYLHRLKREQPRAAPLGQRFFDTMFADFDRSLREMGTGDLSVGREVKRMAQAFYGRIAAYEEGLAASDAVLPPALARNLYGTAPADRGAVSRRWRLTCGARRRSLDRQAAAELLAGQIAFGEPPSAACLRHECGHDDRRVPPEFSRRVPLARLGPEPFRQDIAAGEAERDALARRFDLVAARPALRRCRAGPAEATST